ncbi:MAG: PIG-L family deacetylase [Ilumatobacteraceae bacterium]
MTRTLVCFHAHPDDESMLTAGTMAKAAAAGHRVVLVVATRGERGAADPQLLGCGDGGRDLGAVRATELERSAAALGVARVAILGYGDSGSSGMIASGAARPGTFVGAPINEAAERLATILDEERPDVLTTYDPCGGYGHPDHVRVHHVGRAAAELAGTPAVLEATIDRQLLALAREIVPTLGLQLPTDFVPPDLTTVYSASSDITHAIDVSEQLAAKRASMEAHVSQATSSVTDGAGTTVRTLAVFLGLPPDLFALAFRTEWFVDRALPPGASHTDVFATLGAA